MARDAKILRIVVGSASDVQAERDQVQAVADEVNHGVASERNLVLQVTRWETDSFPSFHAGGPQAIIDSILQIAGCDIFIGIFWKRFGTPVSDARSGTEHEYKQAYEAWKQKGTPQIFFYFNQQRYNPASKAETDQWGMVKEFQSSFPKEGLWWPYKGKANFKDVLRRHLEAYLRKQFPLSAAGSLPDELLRLLKRQEEQQEAQLNAMQRRIDELEYNLRQATAPGPLTRQALALQKQQRDLDAFLLEAMRMIPAKPADAFQSLEQALQMEEYFHAAEKNFLSQMGEGGAAQLPHAVEVHNSTRGQILFARGHAALLMKVMNEAAKAYEEARPSLREGSPDRKFVDRALDFVARQE